MRLQSLCAVLFILAACGESDTPPTTQAPGTPAAQTPAPAAQANDTQNPAAAVTTASAEETQPAQISETDEESGEEPAPTPTATPTLKVAALPPTPKPSRFQEGVHYRRLSPTQPTTASPGQVEVVEAFWYGCAPCFAIDPKLDTWRGTVKPAYVVFTRLPTTLSDIERFHARLFYAAESLGKLEGLHAAIFREIHTANNPLNTAGAATAFFAANGVTKTEFQKTFASTAVEAKLQRADVLNRRYRVENAPYFVVNGKFTTDLAMAGGEEQLLLLINELAVREHGD